ncbi:uncharacterized protein LOC143285804 [Babylonia areolata]|uniref:uncharacterized protein LOC143285804 n=1 Tax=Babylonia areolata TaxID=304850 RepID=UPI003FD02E18
MSGSFTKAAKSYQKVHRERGQPAHRAHLGPLEKKKDYTERAREHHKKRDKIKALQKKAAERNPDEFYFNMVSSQKVDGVHQAKTTETRDEQQDMLLRGQDIRYVSTKLNIERKKIEKLKGELHLLDPQFRANRHTVFVDDDKDVAKAKETLKQTLKTDQLKLMTVSPEQQKEMEKKYAMLAKRYQRLKELTTVLEKLQVAQHLDKDKGSKKKLVKEETKETAAEYRWCFQRKR